MVPCKVGVLLAAGVGDGDELLFVLALSLLSSSSSFIDSSLGGGVTSTLIAPLTANLLARGADGGGGKLIVVCKVCGAELVEDVIEFIRLLLTTLTEEGNVLSKLPLL